MHKPGQNGHCKLGLSVIYSAVFDCTIWSSIFSWLIGCMGGATTFACKSQECLWQDWYISGSICMSQHKKVAHCVKVCILSRITLIMWKSLMGYNVATVCPIFKI